MAAGMDLTDVLGAAPPPRLSTGMEDWATPQDFFDKCNAEFGFTLDACATHENAKCLNYFTKEDDGLKQSWAGHRVWMNPPYGKDIPKWMAKATHEARQRQGHEHEQDDDWQDGGSLSRLEVAARLWPGLRDQLYPISPERNYPVRASWHEPSDG